MLAEGVACELGLALPVASEVALLAAGAQVVGVESLSAFGEGDDVVDVCCLALASVEP